MAVATDGVTYKLKSEGANWIGRPRLHCLWRYLLFIPAFPLDERDARLPLCQVMRFI
jgi:hypothetical protein